MHYFFLYIIEVFKLFFLHGNKEVICCLNSKQQQLYEFCLFEIVNLLYNKIMKNMIGLFEIKAYEKLIC